MSALIILIGISILVAAGFLIAYLWSVKNGQFEDDYTPSVRMLFDNETKKTEDDSKNETENNKTIN
jgi:cbb3-type cytochrome oxidase maturation protein